MRAISYVTFTVIMFILFLMTGIIIEKDYQNNAIAKLILNPSNVSASDFYSLSLTNTINAASAATITIAAIYGQWELAVMVGVATVILNFFAIVTNVYVRVAEMIGTAFAMLVFSPFIIGAILAVLDWWRGRG